MTGPAFMLRLLIDFAAAHRDDAGATGSLQHYLRDCAVPSHDWGQLPFSRELHGRWSRALAERERQLDRLRQRQGDVPDWLRQAAEDFAAVDVTLTARLRALADDYPQSVRADGGEPGVKSSDFDDGTAELSGMPVVPFPRESPGSEELMSCLAEHMTTLERAEGLLRSSGRLDFTAPTDYLRQLSTVQPSQIGGRAEPLAAVSSCLDTVRGRLSADTWRLAESWQGEAAEAFSQHTNGTTDLLAETAAEVTWMSTEAEELCRILDDLLQSVADAVWGHLDTVGASRIARIEAATSLVEDAHSFAPEGVQRAPLWAGLSQSDVDAVVQVLYKRVWYLSNAVADLVSQAGRDVAGRIEADGGDSDE